MVSDVLKGLQTDKVMTLRWAPAEAMGERIGYFKFLTATSVNDMHKALKEVPMLCPQLGLCRRFREHRISGERENSHSRKP